MSHQFSVVGFMGSQGGHCRGYACSVVDRSEYEPVAKTSSRAIVYVKFFLIATGSLEKCSHGRVTRASYDSAGSRGVMTSGKYRASTREWTTVIPQVSSSPDPGIWVTQPRKQKMAFKEKGSDDLQEVAERYGSRQDCLFRCLRARVSRRLLMCWFQKSRWLLQMENYKLVTAATA